MSGSNTYWDFAYGEVGEKALPIFNDKVWKNAPDWANYGAMDADGSWWWYAEKPVTNNRGKWECSHIALASKGVDLCGLGLSKLIYWRLSLSKRMCAVGMALRGWNSVAKLAPEWANYGAIDSDGRFMWFENRPVTLIGDGIVGGWISDGKEEREDRVAFFSSARWFLTLVERPAVSPQKKMTVNDFVKEAHQNAIDKGFWAGKRELGTLLMLVTSELSEALEADRRSNWCVTPVDPDNFDTDEEFKAAFERTQKDTVQDEIADAFIRLADLCGHYRIDTERFIRAKMKYNSLRPVKHGKSY